MFVIWIGRKEIFTRSEKAWESKVKIIFMEKFRLEKVEETVSFESLFVLSRYLDRLPRYKGWKVERFSLARQFMNVDPIDPHFFSFPGIASVACLGPWDWLVREIRVYEKDGGIERLKITLLFTLRYLRNRKWYRRKSKCVLKEKIRPF